MIPKFIVFCLLLSISFSDCIAQKKIQLFNGHNLDGWIPKIKDHPVRENYANTFRVEDGSIKVRYDQYGGKFNDQFGHLFYKKKFSAYLLIVEYRFVGEQLDDGPGWALRNSGLMLHGQSPESMALDQDFPISLEAQLLGGVGTMERTTNNLCTPGTNVVIDGKLVTTHCISSNSATFFGDQWVRAKVLVLGDSLIAHIVNTDTVFRYSKPQYDGTDKWVQQLGLKGGELIKEGTISLQSESHPVDFRKVELYDLSKYLNRPAKLKRKMAKLAKKK